MPATKARFFLVIVRDGHGPKERFIPAFSKEDLLANLRIPNNEQLLDIKHLNHHRVEACPCGDNEVVEFIATIHGAEVRFGPNDQGYAYLRQQFSSQARNVDEFLDSRYADEV